MNREYFFSSTFPFLFVLGDLFKGIDCHIGFVMIYGAATIWQIKPLPFSISGNSRSLVTQTMEIRRTGWRRWRRMDYSKLDRTISFFILCQVAGKPLTINHLFYKCATSLELLTDKNFSLSSYFFNI